ncbi:MAG: serine/threonine protein kinase [Phycisphaerae bacterium]|nr:serine/threonine protein kinase [Phycisphaerae bacterium]
MSAADHETPKDPDDADTAPPQPSDADATPKADSASGPGSGPPSGPAALFFSSVTAPSGPLPDPALPYFLGELLADGKGRYELVSRIGSGVQAAVFRARDRRLGADVPEPTVAVKLYPVDADPSGANQALVEARRTRLAQDTSVITILDVGRTAEGWPYLVMPLLRATDLRSWRVGHQRELSSRLLAYIGRDVAHSLVAVHGARLLHCDVSPQNILIDSGNRAILADFGCAVLATDEIDPGGTPAFMAPERWQNTPPDGPADVAGLGAVLYWLATGEPPYGSTRGDILASHRRHAEADNRRRRALLTAGIDPEIVDLIRQTMAIVPANRPTAHEVETALASWLARGRRGRIGVAIGIGTVAVLLTAFLVWRFAPRTPPVAVALGSDVETEIIASTLGALPTDPTILVVAAQGRSADFALPSVDPVSALAWVDERAPVVVAADPVSRWTVSLLAASLALDVRDLEAADRWLPLAEGAMAEGESLARLSTYDPRWMNRLKGLVAAARWMRIQPSLTGDEAPAPNVAELRRMNDWLEAAIVQGWKGPQGADTRTSAMLRRIQTEIEVLLQGPRTSVPPAATGP